MTQSRRTFLTTSAATVGVITMLPYAAQAAAHGGNTFPTQGGDITVHPVDHASFVMETPIGVIYNDPVGDAANYADFATPDLVLITHEHGDHYNADTLAAVVGENTQIITNPAVYEMLPEALKAKASMVANGEAAMFKELSIEAIPAYNTTPERMKFHPMGRDNGYILNLPDFRVYISGDTEGTPEMRALENIDLAFVCMNLPFTMDAAAAAAAVSAFKPSFVYPYHFRGREDGTQDPVEFAKMVAAETEVKIANWY
ncbi:L-ascorbate metabolism protein UlaG, beta-lactamase superfamily [Sulfitobacter marinus]|uniref:L-ascorbate metabolism protein UlaG, beta-lactamase superfamily n=1 Tax=Sulfitobacter marinus TaxID=394264 RepID=A0A1I6ULU2_9RHOB|nr:MBL fold metallo-hydrolase [Sulfitobacter marinus]SFT02429.1 L-ascorbate metabolism protein UlaG, beta-lactamase superfamily [Sulfitobacter marinus]